MGTSKHTSELIRRAVERAPFPSTRRQLVDFASVARGGRLTEIINQLPDREYRDLDDVLNAYNEEN